MWIFEEFSFEEEINVFKLLIYLILLFVECGFFDMKKLLKVFKFFIEGSLFL